ncbi:exosortase [Saccharospirillum impatiens]|uniref:exosortase n=1 Tax=Saccharospirillum impatiens TaxID=169438 RepID=UPI000427B2E2|nr:exosortase [Saccharospirillum impatiens]
MAVSYQWSATRSRSGFLTQRGLPLFLCLFAAGLFLALAPDTMSALHDRWTELNGTYSHGYLWVPVCLGLVVYRLATGFYPVRPRLMGVLFVGFSAAIWLAGFVIQLGLLQQLALPALLGSLIVAGFGWPALRLTLAPLLGLYLAIPIWDIFTVPLQNLTTVVSTFAIAQWSIPAYIDGYFIHLPYGIVEVAGGCSGLNYSLVAIVLALAYGQQRQLSTPMTLLAVLVLLLLSMVGNWVRVSALILIAYYSEMTSSLVTEHGLFGWAIFCVFYVGFLVWAHRLKPYQPKASSAAQFKATASHQTAPVSPVVQLVLGAATVVIAIGTPWLAQQRVQSNWQMPESWSALAAPGAPVWQPGFHHYDLQFTHQIEHAGIELTLGQRVYLEQTQGKELVGYGNRIAPATDIVQRDTRELDSGRTVQVLELNASGTRRLVIWTYQLGEATAVTDVSAKLRQLQEWLRGRSVTALFYVQTPCTRSGCEAERAALGENLAVVDAWLDQRSLYAPPSRQNAP